MILGNSYDKALCLIIKNNRRNKEEIVDFFKLIPYKFVLDMQDNLNEYEKYKSSDDFMNNNFRYFNSCIYTSYGYLYSYDIDVNTDILSISRSVYQYGAYYKDFEIKLAKIDNINNYEMDNIGSISYGFNNNVDIEKNIGISKLKKYDYAIFKVPFKNMLFVFENNMLIGINCLSEEILNNNIDIMEDKLIDCKKKSLRKD